MPIKVTKTGGVAPPRPRLNYGFVPYQPPPIPTGSYDPSIDAQVGATGRGLDDTHADIATQSSRLTTDYGLGVDQVNRQSGRNLADLTQSRDRGLQGLDTSGQRADQDYQRAVEMLSRSYKNLGLRQQEQQNAAGVLRGGTALQAAAKRAANQGLQQQGLDTGIGRTREDIARQRDQIGQDFTTQSGRISEDQNLSLGQLALNGAPPDANNPLGGRGFQDLGAQGSRAEREAAMFGIDAETLKAFQAGQSGYVPPQPGEPGGRPKNEFEDAAGNPYQVIIHGGNRLYVNSAGKIIKTVKR